MSSMTADQIKVKSHERSHKQKCMEYNHLYARGGPESTMKFSSQLVESPPPKPPRRRYSDQLSAPFLGTYSSNKKCNEGARREDSKLKRCSVKPAYLSLPASLTTSISNEYDDAFSLSTHTSNSSGHFKSSKEKDIFMKDFFENLKFSENNAKRSFHYNRIHNKEKLQSFSMDFRIDPVFSKNQCANFVSCTVDKFLRNSTTKNRPPMTSSCINHCLKSVHKSCHRRHHSDPITYHYRHSNDPAIFQFNLQKENALKVDCECCDNISSIKKSNKYCDCVGSCSCCKKNCLIMQEIRILKEINEKLWQHLCSLQICLENKKKKTYDECADVSVSDLLSSIYYAQKAKDSAMEERLKIVLEERDAALQDLDDLIQVFTKKHDYSDGEKEINEDMKNLLCKIGCTVNPPRLLKHQRRLLSQIDSLKVSKHDGLLHQLRQVTVERDNTLEKIRKLEEDIKNLKICFDLWHSDNKYWEVTVFDVLNQVMRQRDTVLSRINSGLDIGNVIYRLDSIEQNISTFESRSKAIESRKAHHSLHLSDFKQPRSKNSSDEIRKLKEEIFLLNKALECERKRREQSEGKCMKLERLIHILRKKLNGQNIGIPV